MCTVNGKPRKNISDEMCADGVAETKDEANFLAMGGMATVGTVFKDGAVLVMSFWNDRDADMLWLGSFFLITVTDGAANPGMCRGSYPITSGRPTDVKENVLSLHVHSGPCRNRFGRGACCGLQSSVRQMSLFHALVQSLGHCQFPLSVHLSRSVLCACHIQASKV